MTKFATHMRNAIMAVLVLVFGTTPAFAQEPVRIGVIFSQTGTMMTSERPLLAATRVAIEDVNRSGGVMGRRVEAVVVDGGSDPNMAASAARRLIDEEGVTAIFGCWTSACRKAVMRVIESRRSVLFYPVQYEGTGFGEEPRDPSPRVIYSGAAPNQQIVPSVQWALQALPSGQNARIYLVGSDYVFPRSANALIRSLVKLQGGSIVGERYEPLGRADFKGLAEDLERSKPNIIFNTVNGIDNSGLFEILARLDPQGDRYLTLSFSVEETQIREIGAGRFVNRYAAWNYFHSASNPRIADFLPRYRQYLEADDAQTSDPVEAAYLQTMLFAQAARRAGSIAPDDVIRAARGLVLSGFSDMVRVDPENQHLWKNVEIRKFGPRRLFDPIWKSGYPIRPDAAPDVAGVIAAIAKPASREDEAMRLLSSDAVTQRLSGLLYLRESQPAATPAAAVGPSLGNGRDWSEQLLAATILLNDGRPEAIDELTLALNRNADNNFSLLVLLLMADKMEVEPPGPLLAAAFDIMQKANDPLIKSAAIRALARNPDDLGARLEVVLATGASAADASVTLQAIRALQVSPKISRAALMNARAILERSDAQTAPELADSMCQALAVVGKGIEGGANAEAATPFVELIESLPAPLAGRCAGATQSADAVRGNVFARWLAAIMPNTLQGWLTLLAVAIPAALILYKAFQTAFIAFFPAVGLRYLRPFRPSRIPLLNQLSKQTLDVLALARIPARQKGAIRRWIEKNRSALLECSLPISGIRAPFQPLLVKETHAGREGTIVPDETYFRNLIDSRTCRGEILGEGGIGKSTFALELLRAASLDNPSAQRFGVFLPAETIGDPENAESIIEAVQARLSAALRNSRRRDHGDVETDDSDFVRRLLADGHIVLVVDDLPRFVGHQWRLSMTPTFPEIFNRLFYTGRTDIAEIERTIEPLTIDKQRALTFVDTHLALLGDVPLSPNEKGELDDSLEGLFAGRTMVPAQFAKMAAEEVQRRRSRGTALGEFALSMPEMVLAHVEHAFAKVPKEELVGIDLRDYWKPLGALAWLCLSTGLRVAPVSRANAIETLKPYGDADVLLKLICTETQLGHYVSNDRVVMASDALAEYLAALWAFDAKAPDSWGNVRTRIEKVFADSSARVLSLPTQTFLSALLDVADRSGSEGRATLDQTSAPPGAARVIEAWLAKARMDAGELRVGVLHSETGEMAISERPVIEATLLAIERLNARGGVAGRRVVPIRLDGQSDPAAFAAAARQLLLNDVTCIFGCWTSASRIEVLKVLEREKKGLLFYPVQYEGYEANPRALYFGAAPNQQLTPAIDWSVANGARSFMLVGSDYVFPRIANEIMSADLKRRSADGVRMVSAPLYVPLRRGWNFDAIVDQIRCDPPDIILNTINGLGNLEFFWRLWELKNGADGERYRHTKVMSFSLGDYEVQRIGAEIAAGHYASWTYFASLEDQANAAFLRAMRTHRGIFFPSDPAEAAYVQVAAFADAAMRLIEKGTAITPESIRQEVLGARISAPSGRLRVDQDNGHLYKIPRIGELKSDGFFHVVWEAAEPLKPEPMPFPELQNTIASIRKQYHT